MSYFEVAIKLKIGKLADFNVTLSEFIDTTYRSGYNTLAIKDEHFKSYAEIDFHDLHQHGRADGRLLDHPAPAVRAALRPVRPRRTAGGQDAGPAEPVADPVAIA